MKKNPYSLYEVIVLLVFSCIAVLACHFFWHEIFILSMIAVALSCALFYTIETLETKRMVVEFKERHGLESMEIAEIDIKEIREMATWKNISEDEAEYIFFSRLSKK